MESRFIGENADGISLHRREWRITNILPNITNKLTYSSVQSRIEYFKRIITSLNQILYKEMLSLD